MGLSKIQKTGVAAMLGLATVFGAVNGAQAMDVRCGYSPAEISAAMKAEGQKPIITADRTAANTSPIQLFTSNSQGNGYLVEGDQPVGKNSSSFCVTLKINDIHLYDARKPGVPNAALSGGRHDEYLKTSAKNGNNVFMQGTGVASNGQQGSIITVTGNYNEGTGGMVFSKGSEIKFMAAFKGMKYSNEALAILGASVR